MNWRDLRALLDWFPITAPVLLVGVSLAAHAAPAHSDLSTERLEFEHLGAEQGLSQQVVRSIEQDHIGYMWFGTQDGLNKYDGYAFAVYRHDPDNPHSLPNNSVAAIHEDRQGTLWIGTSGGGLSRFDRETDSFRNFQYDSADPASLSDNTVSFIYEDRGGTPRNYSCA